MHYSWSLFLVLCSVSSGVTTTAFPHSSRPEVGYLKEKKSVSCNYYSSDIKGQDGNPFVGDNRSNAPELSLVVGVDIRINLCKNHVSSD